MVRFLVSYVLDLHILSFPALCCATCVPRARARRSFQGWAISSWDTAYQASQFEGFVRSVPQGQFVVIDMSEDGKGFWKKWDESSFFGAPFIWTSLHDFGGNDGMKVRPQAWNRGR